MKRILTILCAFALLVPVAFGVVGCKKKKKSKSAGSELGLRNVYAISAVAGVDYLKSSSTVNGVAVATAITNSGARPDVLSDQNIADLGECLKLFDSAIENGVSQTIEKNKNESGEFANYKFVMTISLPVSKTTYKMYFNEIDTKTQKEIEDLDEEIEISTTLEGVVVVGEEKFLASGVHEIETEKNEHEESVEFKIASETNPENYVIVSRSNETEANENEVEYEYKVFKNGKCVLDIETEIEDENGQVELEFKIKDRTNGSLQKTKYKINKGAKSDFVISYVVDKTKDTISVNKTENGYQFTYSNGYTESV